MKICKWSGFLDKTKNAAKGVVRDERGVVTTETVVVIALVAIVAVGLLVIMNPAIQGLFSSVLTGVTDMVNGTIGG
jgi:uncharacterized membrane protein HdeD (DUF308 family)